MKTKCPNHHKFLLGGVVRRVGRLVYWSYQKEFIPTALFPLPHSKLHREYCGWGRSGDLAGGDWQK